MQKILFLLLCTTLLYPSSKTETAGDIFALLIPSLAYESTLVTHDYNGQVEFYKSYGSTLLLTYILKETVRLPRPTDPGDHTSFPSGHTSSAFSGATFIHKKYGFKDAIPAYLGAIYTAYSRVHTKKHYTKDVLAGAFLGIGLTSYFTTPYKNVNIVPNVDTSAYGLQFNYTW